MGLYKRCECGCDERRKCEHDWWYRFTVAGYEHRGTTRTEDRCRAEIEERRQRAYYEGQAPASRSGRAGLADLGGLDIERAIANGSTQDQVKALSYFWRQITRLLGVTLRQLRSITLACRT